MYVSCGDINGIGLELILRNHEMIAKWCKPIYCVSWDLLARAAKLLGIKPPITMQLHEVDSTGISIQQGMPTQQSGQYSFESFCTALELSIKHNVGLVTLPINKYAWNLAGIQYAGHTEYLRERFQKNAIMMLGCEEMFVALFTDHIPLNAVAQNVQKERLTNFLRDFYLSFFATKNISLPIHKEDDKMTQERNFSNISQQESATTKTDYKDYTIPMELHLDKQMNALKHYALNYKMVARLLDINHSLQESDDMLLQEENTNSLESHRNKGQDSELLQIAVLGLNPHAGDNGVLGNEDFIIKDCIESLNQILGHEVFVGPIAPDSAFIPSNRKKFKIFVAMYHDSGLAPLKSLYFDRSINVSLNLPILRTSPDHGTGYDKAYKVNTNLNMQSYLESFKFLILRTIHQEALQKSIPS
nr:4-hydroxythreonine-4-phosphate dehydrogenase PdxA [Helicobacter didelphidarum]